MKTSIQEKLKENFYKPMCTHKHLSLSRWDSHLKTWNQVCLNPSCRQVLTFHEGDLIDNTWMVYAFCAVWAIGLAIIGWVLSF